MNFNYGFCKIKNFRKKIKSGGLLKFQFLILKIIQRIRT